VSGRAKGAVSRDRHQKVWWYLRRDFSQREIAGKLGISVGTVSYYVRQGIPPYDPDYDTDRPIQDDLLTEAERRARTTTVRLPRAPKPEKSYVSRTPRPPKVASLDAARRRRA
jgi:transcriptional regulator with XRE-family HTH domain